MALEGGRGAPRSYLQGKSPGNEVELVPPNSYLQTTKKVLFQIICTILLEILIFSQSFIFSYFRIDR